MDELRDLLAIANSMHMRVTIMIFTDGSGHVSEKGGARRSFTSPTGVARALAEIVDGHITRRGVLDRILGRK